MATFRNFISAFFGLFLLTQCNSNSSDTNEPKETSLSTKTKSQGELSGEWKYINSIWYSSEITLQDNGTFKFHDQDCYGQNFTEGQWSRNNDIIALTSYSNYKPEIINDQGKSLKENIREAQKKKSPILPGPDDTIRIYFDHFQFQLKNDTLYCMDKNQLFESGKFYKTNNR